VSDAIGIVATSSTALTAAVKPETAHEARELDPSAANLNGV
jgi:hypothetical protein